MKRLTRIFVMVALALSVPAALMGSVPSEAYVPGGTHYHRYIEANGSYSYWNVYKDDYVKNTLPNEWLLEWSDNALRAGAVIIRSGVYWRVNRSLLGSPYPNNNCYQGGSGDTRYYRTVPNSRGGEEEWLPYSAQTKTNSAVDSVLYYHAERVSLPSGRPDKLVSSRYNDVVQNRTQQAGDTWLNDIRYAYVGPGSQGAPFDPNQECSQQDDQTSTDPMYLNN